MVAGGGFIPMISTKGIYQIKKGNCKKKKKFYTYKKIYYILKNKGAIPNGCNSTSTLLNTDVNSFRKKFDKIKMLLIKQIK